MTDEITPHSGPDDPYQVTSYTDDQGNVHFVVSADVLSGDDVDTAEVRAECERRAAEIRDWMLDFLRPKDDR